MESNFPASCFLNAIFYSWFKFGNNFLAQCERKVSTMKILKIKLIYIFSYRMGATSVSYQGIPSNRALLGAKL